MKRVSAIIVIVLLSLLLGWFAKDYFSRKLTKVGRITEKILPRPLDKYTIQNLSTTQILPEKIEVGETIKEEKNFTAYLFSFYLDPTLKNSPKKKVAGLLNIPKGQGTFPLVVMFRGYVDQKIYATGTGTQRAGEYLARNGFITIAPDFLGYGGSDPEAENIFESRFQTYVTALTLLESAGSVPGWDGKNIFIWGHSNGGQIALTVLEITNKAIPTTLWAPVSKPFPYSILYYTDESEDRGKLIRRELSKFEETYDPDLYAIDLYYERIKAPVVVHQGTNDDAVPREWSDELTKKFNELEIDFDYFVYPGADHNLNPSWGTVVARDLAFFKKKL